MRVPSLIWCAALAVTGFSVPHAWAEPVPSPDKEARLFRVPPDFPIRRNHGEGEQPAIGDKEPPADPFAAPDPAAPRNLPPLPRYPHVIHALGSRLPIDARPTLEDLGIAFRKGDAALISPDDRTLLFVIAEKGQMELIQTILAPMDGEDGPGHLQVTWKLRRTNIRGAKSVLLERSVIVRSGQRASFQRSRRGDEVERAEVEASLREDQSVDTNADLQLRSGKIKLHAQGRAILRLNDAAPAVLYSTAGANPGEKLEVLLSAKLANLSPERYRFGSAAHSTLAAMAAAEVAAAEAASSSPVRRAEIIPIRLEDLKVGGESVEVSFPKGRRALFTDVSKSFASMAGTREDRAKAWYSDAEKLLYLLGDEHVIAAASGMAVSQKSPELGQYELQLALTAGSGRKSRPPQLRGLLVLSGQTAKASTCGPGVDESIEAELSVNDAGSMADVNLMISKLKWGSETWTFSGLVLAEILAVSPVTLVSGRTVEGGKGFRQLQLSVQPRDGYWPELLRNPLRRAAALGTLEAALLKK